MFIYDIEIQRGIAPANSAERKSDVVYCDGWTDYENMGVSCIGVYDYCSDKYRIFGENELAEFQQFADEQDRAIGFNNIRFDNNVLLANGVTIVDNKSYDILFEIYRKLGSFQKGCRLENVVKANFPNAGKSGNGADAPEDWQRGRYTKVIDYCLNDVRLTKMILDKILRFGFINNPVKPDEVLHLRRP